MLLRGKMEDGGDAGQHSRGSKNKRKEAETMSKKNCKSGDIPSWCKELINIYESPSAKDLLIKQSLEGKPTPIKELVYTIEAEFGHIMTVHDVCWIDFGFNKEKILKCKNVKQ